MSEEKETIIRTDSNVRLSISEWDEGGVWLHLMASGATMHTILLREEAETLLKGLQAILAKEVST